MKSPFALAKPPPTRYDQFKGEGKIRMAPPDASTENPRMSTVEIADVAARKTRPLVAGLRLSQAEFHDRYQSMPPGTRAELIGGTVQMPSPVGPDHAKASADLVTWLNLYRRKTRGTEALDNASTLLDELGELQPDALLRILPEYGGRTRTDRRYVIGPPELVVEVARSTRFVDLGPKRLDYERSGVLEYLVRALEPDEILWHVRRDNTLSVVEPDADGIYRSRVFPGLWLDPAALLCGDLDSLIACLELGLATPEHREFAEQLTRQRDDHESKART